MIDDKDPKKNSSCHYRWPIIISIVLLIPAVIMTIVFVIQVKGNSQSSVISALNKSSTNQKHNVNYEKYVFLKKGNQCFIYHRFQ